MATAKESFKKSVKDSDMFYDCPCTPCEKEGKNVEAEKYCVDCDENLCGHCLTLHKKFAVTRGHNLSDKVQPVRGQSKTLPSQRCLKHAGKTIDVYCPTHDDVGCSVCIAVDHSTCVGKQFIPDVASGIQTSTELKQLDEEIKRLNKKLESLEKHKRGNIQYLKQRKEALIKEIKLVRKKMNDQLDLMEKALVNETDTMFKEKIDGINNTIKELETMLELLKRAAEKITTKHPDVDVFVACKIMKRKLTTEYYPMYDRIDFPCPDVRFDLQIDKDMKLLMEGKRVLATIKGSIMETRHEQDFIPRVDDDEYLCTVEDMCILSDGCLLLADIRNMALKKFNPVSGNLSTLIGVPDTRFHLCQVDNTCLALSLFNMKKIQFVTLSSPISLTTSFSVGERCRALAHCDGLLYVCCEESLVGLFVGKDRVKVYDCNGKLLRCFDDDRLCPFFISVVKKGSNISIVTADYYKGVMVRGKDGAMRHKFNTAINAILPFCLIDTDTICIGEYAFSTIYTQTVNDKQILVEPRNLKGKPLCLQFDKSTSRLYVCVRVGNNEDDVIQVFKLV